MKILTNLMFMVACAVLLTSCGTMKGSYDFRTAGITHTDSSYLITASGRHVDATNIDVKPGKVTVDGKPYPLDSISSIRSNKMYFGVRDRTIYLGEFYGKINLLYQLVSVPTYATPYGQGAMYAPGGAFYNSMVTGHTTQRKYYIQKRGSTTIDRMTTGAVVDYVADNDEALQIARGARSWKRVYLASWAGIIAGSVWAFKNVFSTGTDASGHIKPVNFTGPSIVLVGAVAGATVSSYIYNPRMLKAIDVYNR